jgi:GDP/UDP-N,N'-diacetylbacillosamine 2-epimerase (hydrolysing)
MKKRKICVVTGTRAEYGLLRSLIQKINDDNELSLQLVATGMHLSPEFGYTYKEIENDGFNIDRKVEILISSDSSIGISKAMGLAQISFSEVFDELKPDIIVILGDRFEMFAICSVAMIAKIPVAHLYGGELTVGAYDDAFRHAITKMSMLHFTSTQQYQKRVIQLGESPDRVFYVGSLGVENIRTQQLLSKIELEKKLQFNFLEKNIIITFHPETLSCESASSQFQQLLSAVSTLSDTLIIFTKANADTSGRAINKMIDKFVLDNENAISFTSLGQLNYLSCLQFVDCVLGNSSSGIVEAPSFKVCTINIGNRQKGRIRANQTIDIQVKSDKIIDALNQTFSMEFKDKLIEVTNPYEMEGTSNLILDKLKTGNLNDLKEKVFYDLEWVN